MIRGRIIRGPPPLWSNYLYTVENHQAACRQYLSERRSTFEFRCNRYRAVEERLKSIGLGVFDMIMDIGAGTQDFFKYMDTTPWTGLYLPVDGAIDGTDLNVWEPPCYSDFFVAIELLEHIHDPWRLVGLMEKLCHKGVVITTPNSAVVDTLAIDPTHVTPLYEEDFRKRGWQTKIDSIFCKPNDTIIAWFKRT